MHLDVDYVTSDEAKCYRLFEVQLSRVTSQIYIIGPDFVSSLDFNQPIWEIIQIVLSHCECFVNLRLVMLVGVSNKFYLIVIISRFIYISCCVMSQCCHPLIMLLSCLLRQVNLYKQLVLFVARHVILLAICVLLEDKPWKEE